MMKPTVGRIVHFVIAGNAVGAPAGCRAALITEVGPVVGEALAIFGRDGALFLSDVPQSNGEPIDPATAYDHTTHTECQSGEGGRLYRYKTWHEPERAKA